MTISFPGSPADGATYTPGSPAPSYVYSATTGLWNIVGSGITSVITTINLGSTPGSYFALTVTDSAITSASVIDATVLMTTTTDNDAEAHRHAGASWPILPCWLRQFHAQHRCADRLMLGHLQNPLYALGERIR